jgi:Ca2+-transporting ATPase
LAADGPNELPRAGRRRLPRILRDVEPVFALLLGSGVIYLALGDALEAALLLVFVRNSVSCSTKVFLNASRPTADPDWWDEG